MAGEVPRTLEELRRQLLALGPTIRCAPGELSDALDTIVVAIIEEIEKAIFTLHDRRYICRADGSWLDEHGRERGIMRFAGEGDEPYRDRIKSIEDLATRPAILDHVDALLKVGTSRMEEWLTDGAFSDILDPRGFADTSHAHSKLRGFTVFIAEQLLARSDRAYALDVPAVAFTTEAGINYTFAGDVFGGDSPDVSAFADGTDPTPGDIYSRIWNEIDRVRAGGLGPFPHFRVEIE